jgi:hypothetical protein
MVAWHRSDGAAGTSGPEVQACERNEDPNEPNSSFHISNSAARAATPRVDEANRHPGTFASLSSSGSSKMPCWPGASLIRLLT